MINLFLLQSGVTDATLEVAQNIHEYGIAVVICSLFVVLSAALMITCFKWFKSIIEQIMSNYSVQLSKLYEVSNRNGEVLVDIAEGLVSETILRTKTICESLLDTAFLKSKDLVPRVIEENNIQDKEATKKKVMVLISNIFEDVYTKANYFTFKGKPLSHYMDKESWVKLVSEAVYNEIYLKVNSDRTYTNVKMIYDNIELEIFHNINNIKRR
jgi:hypothetical protein